MYRSGVKVSTSFARIIVIASLVASCNGSAFAQAPQLQGLMVDFPESNPVDLGIGWNSRVSDKVSRVCIDFVRNESGYQDRRLAFEVITDNQSLANALKVSVAAKFKAITGAGGSAAVDFARKTKLSSASTNIAVLAEVFESPIYVAPTPIKTPVTVPITNSTGGKVDLTAFYAGNAVSLKNDLRALAGSNPAEFYRQCGDSFVAVIHRGAKLVGNISFSETSREERESLDVAASGGAAMWSVQGNLSSSMEKFGTSNRLNINFAQFGGTGGILPLNRENFMKAIEQLPEASKQAPKPFAMIVQRYDSLPSWPSKIGSTELSDLEVLANAAWQLDSLLMYIDETLYRAGWLLKFDTKRSDVEKVYDRVLSERIDIRADAKKCIMSGDCNRKKWQGWTDLPYRIQLPLKGTLSDLQYPVGDNSLESMIEALASARTAYWIEGPARIRCRNEDSCLTQAQKNAARKQIRDRLFLSIDQ